MLLAQSFSWGQQKEKVHVVKTNGSTGRNKNTALVVLSEIELVPAYDKDFPDTQQGNSQAKTEVYG